MAVITTVIPTYDRPRLLMERAIPSVLAQVGDWECIVVGDGTDGQTVAAMDALCAKDARFRFWNPPRTPLPDDPLERWKVMGVVPFNFGLDQAQGEWVSYLADDDEYRPDHHRLLLERATHDADVIHGLSRAGTQTYGAKWPVDNKTIVQGAYLLRASLGHRADPVPRDVAWDIVWWQGLLDRGARFRYIGELVHIYHPEPAQVAYHGTGT
jgi:glycosyltransferase involved in cell wall biosynthesis